MLDKPREAVTTERAQLIHTFGLWRTIVQVVRLTFIDICCEIRGHAFYPRSVERKLTHDIMDVP